MTLFNRLKDEIHSLPVGTRTNDIIESTAMRALATVNINYMAGFGEVMKSQKKNVADKTKFSIPKTYQGLLHYTFASKDMTNGMKKDLRGKLKKLSSMLLLLVHAGGAGALIDTKEKIIAFLTKACEYRCFLFNSSEVP